jgi:hypothetical protein
MVAMIRVLLAIALIAIPVPAWAVLGEMCAGPGDGAMASAGCDCCEPSACCCQVRPADDSAPRAPAAPMPEPSAKPVTPLATPAAAAYILPPIEPNSITAADRADARPADPGPDTQSLHCSWLR